MSVDPLARKPDAPKSPTTGKVKPSIYISPEVVREIFEGVSPPGVSPPKLGATNHQTKDK
jgi:hypothetical protein